MEASTTGGFFFISLQKTLFFAIVRIMKPRGFAAKAFHFKGYRYDSAKLRAAFDYEIEFVGREPVTFTETISLPKKPVNVLSKKELAKFLEPLHLILGISYYKLYCPSKVTLPFTLSKDEAEFWNTVYKKGLGEFLYRNKLDPKIVAQFPFGKVVPTPIQLEVSDSVLLGIGGGKDSIAAAELLKEGGFTSTSFLIESQRPDFISETIINEIGNPSLLIKRTLDPKIFEAYEGSYNGHIPVSAVFAFLGLLFIYLGITN